MKTKTTNNRKTKKKPKGIPQPNVKNSQTTKQPSEPISTKFNIFVPVKKQKQKQSTKTKNKPLFTANILIPLKQTTQTMNNQTPKMFKQKSNKVNTVDKKSVCLIFMQIRSNPLYFLLKWQNLNFYLLIIPLLTQNS